MKYLLFALSFSGQTAWPNAHVVKTSQTATVMPQSRRKRSRWFIRRRVLPDPELWVEPRPLAVGPGVATWSCASTDLSPVKLFRSVERTLHTRERHPCVQGVPTELVTLANA